MMTNGYYWIQCNCGCNGEPVILDFRYGCWWVHGRGTALDKSEVEKLEILSGPIYYYGGL